MGQGSVLSGTIALSISLVFQYLTILAVIILIARNYSVEEFGVYALIMAITNIFYILVDFGQLDYAVKTMSSNSRYSLINPLIKTKLLIFIILIFALIPVSLLSGTIGSNLCIMALSVLPHGFLLVFNSVYRSMKKYHIEKWLNIFKSMLILLFTGLFIIFELPLFTIFVGYVAAYILTGVLSYIVLRNEVALNTVSKSVFSTLKDSYKYFLAHITEESTIRLVPILLFIISGSLYLAYYDVAYKLFNHLLYFPFVFNSVLLSYISKKKDNLFFSQKTRHYLYIVSLVGLCMFILSEPIILVIFGSDYIGGSMVLKILSVAFLFESMNYMYRTRLISLDRISIVFIVNFFTLITVTILCILLVPLYNHIGAALALATATLFSSVIFNFLSRYYYKQYEKYPYHEKGNFL
jgi:O-antigen/teichoic acid export membrane protein